MGQFVPAGFGPLPLQIGPLMQYVASRSTLTFQHLPGEDNVLAAGVSAGLLSVLAAGVGVGFDNVLAAGVGAGLVNVVAAGVGDGVVAAGVGAGVSAITTAVLPTVAKIKSTVEIFMGVEIGRAHV